MMKRKYMSPVVRGIALQQQQHLLAVSGEISGYSKSSNSFSQDDDSTDQ